MHSGPALPRDAPPPMPGETPATKRQRLNEPFVLEPEDVFVEKLPGGCPPTAVLLCADVQVCMCAEMPAEVHVCRCAGVQVCRCAGVHSA
jgi:hypothetical protein